MSQTSIFLKSSHSSLVFDQEPDFDKTPSFFIVGAPKCGTSSLNEYLKVDERIYLANKEMHYFGRDLNFGPQIFRRSDKEYLAEFAAHRGQARMGEASVWYLYSRTAAEEIRAFNPEAKIIIMLREPVSMIHSLYEQFRCDGNEPFDCFEQALAAEGDRRAGRRLGRTTYFAQGLIYRDVARYTEQVQRYFKAFGRDQVKVILFDDFTKNTAEVYRETLEFLRISPKGAQGIKTFGVVNGCREVRNAWFRSLLQDPWIRGTIVGLHRRVPKPVFRWLQRTGAKVCRWNERPVARKEMNPETTQSLLREFDGEIEQLGDLLGRDLSHWRGSKNTDTKMATTPR